MIKPGSSKSQTAGRDIKSEASVGAQAGRGARWTLLGQWSRLVCQILSVVILARLLTPEDYGLFSIVAALAGFATVIGDFGLSSAAIQSKFLSNQQRSNLLWINFGIGILAAGILAAIAIPLGSFYDHPMVTPVTFAMSVNFLLLSLTTQFAANVTRGLRFGLLFVADFLGPVLGLVAAITLAVFGFGVWALVGQHLLVGFVRLLVLAFGGRWRPSLPRKAPMAKLLSYGSLAFAAQVLVYASSHLSSVLLGRFHEASAAGVYDRARQINSLPSSQLATPLARVMLPLLSRLQDDLDRLSYYLSRAGNVLAYLVGAVMVVLAVFSEPIVLLALGPGWETVAPILSILSVGGFFSAMGHVLQWGFMATGRVGVQLSFSIFTRSIMLVMLLLAAPYGVVALALATSLGLTFNWVVLYIFALPRTGISLRMLWGPLMRPLMVHVFVITLVYISRLFMTYYGVEQVTLWVLLLGVLIFGYIFATLVSAIVRKDIAFITTQLVRKVKHDQ